MSKVSCSCRLRKWPVPAAQRQSLLLQARKAPLPSGSTITVTVTLYIVPPRDIGKENGNYYIKLGFYRINGKENGNYYFYYGAQKDCFSIMDKHAKSSRFRTEVQGCLELPLKSKTVVSLMKDALVPRFFIDSANQQGGGGGGGAGECQNSL